MKTQNTPAYLLVLFLAFLVTCTISKPQGIRFIRISKKNSDLIFFHISVLNTAGENVADGKTVKPKRPYNPPRYLVNNKLGSTYVGSSKDPDNEIQIDLGREYYDITQLDITNRPDCCPGRNLYAKVETLTQDKERVDLFTITSKSKKLVYNTKYGVKWFANANKCDYNHYISKVRLVCHRREWLHIMRMEFFDFKNQKIDSSNFKASMSSLYSSSYPAKNILDGNSHTMAHTKNHYNEYIQVEFDKPRDNIKRIYIYNRPGSNSKRIYGCYMYLIDEHGHGLERKFLNSSTTYNYYPYCQNLTYKKKKLIK